MPKDTLTLLDQYVSAEEPRKWAKLSSTITYRRLVLLTLREILLELQALNGREMAGDAAAEDKTLHTAG
jgi:hypothetical protein